MGSGEQGGRALAPFDLRQLLNVWAKSEDRTTESLNFVAQVVEKSGFWGRKVDLVFVVPGLVFVAENLVFVAPGFDFGALDLDFVARIERRAQATVVV